MALWVRAALAAAVLVVPGGLLVLVGFALARALYLGWVEARLSAKGGEVQLKDVLKAFRPMDVLRETRTAALSRL